MARSVENRERHSGRAQNLIVVKMPCAGGHQLVQDLSGGHQLRLEGFYSGGILQQHLTVHSLGGQGSQTAVGQGQWEELVEKPLREAGQPVPRWVVQESPYRRLFTPLLSYLEGVRSCHPQREILVVVGELVENRWYQFFLHNQHAQVLKALLRLHGGRNVAVVSTPWRLSQGPISKLPMCRPFC